MSDISYIDKNKNATPGTAPTLWTDSDANEVKAAVNTKVDKVTGSGLIADSEKAAYNEAINTLQQEVAAISASTTDITIAASDATATEKTLATYVCDGTADEVQWALANTAAAGRPVKLLGRTFQIDNDIILTSHFQGIGNSNDPGETRIGVASTATIKLHFPGNITNVHILSSERTSNSPALKLEVLQTTGIYEFMTGLLQGVRLWSADTGGIGLEISVQGGDEFQFISFCTFGDIGVANFDTGVVIKCYESGANAGFINSNTFNSIITHGCNIHMYIGALSTPELNIGQVAANCFKSVHMQCTANCTQGVYICDNTGTYKNSGNQFLSFEAMDWTAVPSIRLGLGNFATHARGFIVNPDYSGRASENDIRSNESQILTNGGTVNVTAAGVLTVNGSGTYLVGSETGLSQFITELYGCNYGDIIILRRATAGVVINVSTYIGLQTDFLLYDAKDLVMLFSIGGAQFTLIGSNKI